MYTEQIEAIESVKCRMYSEIAKYRGASLYFSMFHVKIWRTQWTLLGSGLI